MSTKVILIAHGNLGLAFLDSLTMIAGAMDPQEVIAMEFSMDESRDALQERIEAELLKMDVENNHLVICCDMQGGSPFNASYLLSKKYQFSIICGMNLPLLLEFILMKDSYESKEQLIELVEMTKESLKVI